MVIYVMGPPRAKNGAHTSRPILAMIGYMQYHSYNDSYAAVHTGTNPTSVYQTSMQCSQPETMNAVLFHGEDAPSVNCGISSMSNSRLTPCGFQSYQKSGQEFDEDIVESLFEIERQKQVMLYESITQLNETKESFLLDFDSMESEVPTQSLFSSLRAPSYRTPSSKFFNSGYIHESQLDWRAPPCRNDFLYAAENNGTQTFLLAEKPDKIVLRVPSEAFDVFWNIEWGESVGRSALLVQEERARGKLRGSEISECLALLRKHRRNAKFHEQNSSSLGAIRRKEKQYFEEGLAYRAQRIKSDHRAFMSSILPERLPPLKLPSIDKEGRKYKITPVDYEVARALAVEEKVRYFKTGQISFFPGIL